MFVTYHYTVIDILAYCLTSANSVLSHAIISKMTPSWEAPGQEPQEPQVYSGCPRNSSCQAWSTFLAGRDMSWQEEACPGQDCSGSYVCIEYQKCLHASSHKRANKITGMSLWRLEYTKNACKMNEKRTATWQVWTLNPHHLMHYIWLPYHSTTFAYDEWKNTIYI